MARKVKEWIGKTPDTRPPPRVLLRIWEREGGRCHLSGRKIMPGEKWQADHKIALINGGENRESNLFPALVDKHKEKTRADVAEKSRVADKAKANLGLRRKSSLAAREPQRRATTPTTKIALGPTAWARRFTEDA